VKDTNLRNYIKNLTEAIPLYINKFVQCIIYRQYTTISIQCYKVVLYGCETWSFTLREERKLRVFENMVLRRIFGPRRD